MATVTCVVLTKVAGYTTFQPVLVEPTVKLTFGPLLTNPVRVIVIVKPAAPELTLLGESDVRVGGG